MRDVVVFVSFCTVYRDPRSSFFTQRTLVYIIVRRSDETKGYRVCLKKGNVVIISQHVENILTLSNEHNSKLQRAIERNHQDS